MTTQPQWRLLANLGDVHPLDYGGYFVYVDETGAYPPEAELLELLDPDNEESDCEVHRFILDQCTFIDSVLSDNKFHPEHPAWFADTLGRIAGVSGLDAAELIEMLCASDPIQRAEGYRAIGDYHGFDNFDNYPRTLTRTEAKKRYNR